MPLTIPDFVFNTKQKVDDLRHQLFILNIAFVIPARNFGSFITTTFILHFLSSRNEIIQTRFLEADFRFRCVEILGNTQSIPCVFALRNQKSALYKFKDLKRMKFCAGFGAKDAARLCALQRRQAERCQNSTASGGFGLLRFGYILISVQPKIIIRAPSITARSHIGKTNAVKIPAMYARVQIPHGRQSFFFFKHGHPLSIHCTKEGAFLLHYFKQAYLCALRDSLKTAKAFKKLYMRFTYTCSLFKIVYGEKSAVFPCISN